MAIDQLDPAIAPLVVGLRNAVGRLPLSRSWENMRAAASWTY